VPLCHLDHIVITAPDLTAGVELVRHALGVAPEVGGEHPRMGTHNCFLKLGEKVYLEVISANPDASRPGRPRWFQLDQPKSTRTPRLAAWIARTDDIHAAVAASPVSLGNVEPMSRGPLNWLITITEDGSLPLQGVAPMLIQWPSGTHPTSTLRDSGCSLIRLEGFHPEAGKVKSLLESIGFQDENFSVSHLPAGERPYLVAHIQTPAGPRRL
jgi:hypothetical protein